MRWGTECTYMCCEGPGGWDERQRLIARMALSMMAMRTDTGAERAEIAVMLADLSPDMPVPRAGWGG